MSRMVVKIQQFGTNTVFNVSEGVPPGEPPTGMGHWHFPPPAPTWIADFKRPNHNRLGLAGDAGDDIHKCLNQHGHYTAALSAAQASGGTRSILVHLDVADPSIEEIPWETLRAGTPPHFLALNPLSPIGRSAGSAQVPVIARTLEATVRVLVVLAARGISALEQLKEIRAAFHASPLHWDLRILAKDEEVEVEAQDWLAHLKPNQSLNYTVFKNRQDLIGEIAASKPNILHFFCHGTAGAMGNGTSQASPTLLLATTYSEMSDMPEDVFITVNDLVNNPHLKAHLWLLVLNCCDSARSAGLPSMASSLVQGAIPAVVGMREIISPQHAHLFCQPFYREALALIEAAGKVSNSNVEWAVALVNARVELVTAVRQMLQLTLLQQLLAQGESADQAKTKAQQQALALPEADIRVWTAPIIYVRPESFQLLAHAHPAPPPTVAPPPPTVAPTLNPELVVMSTESLMTNMAMLKDFRQSNGANLAPAELLKLENRLRDIKAILLTRL